MSKLIVRPDILSAGQDAIVTFVDDDREVNATVTASVEVNGGVETISLKLRNGVGANFWTVPMECEQVVFSAPGCENVTRFIEQVSGL